MLAKRIIPTILCRGRTMVKGIAFESWRSVGLAAQAVRIHSMRGVDELVLLDIAATTEGRGPDLRLVEELAETCFMPLAVGGGVTSPDQARDLLNAGADKIVLGNTLFHTDTLERCARRFGSQAMVASVDVKQGKVWSKNGTMCQRMNPVSFARLCQEWGAGEILLNDIEREGTMQGYDLQLIDAVTRAVTIPVVVAGGAGTYAHLVEAVHAGADAVAMGAMLQFTEATPRGAAQYLSNHGIEVRL